IAGVSTNHGDLRHAKFVYERFAVLSEILDLGGLTVGSVAIGMPKAARCVGRRVSVCRFEKPIGDPTSLIELQAMLGNLRALLGTSAKPPERRDVGREALRCPVSLTEADHRIFAIA